jgi:hypothetical protein
MLQPKEPQVDKLDDLTVGEVVYVKSKNEKGIVKAIHPPTIIVRFLTSELEVQEGDIEKQAD